jgi:hypothetical protein
LHPLSISAFPIDAKIGRAGQEGLGPSERRFGNEGTFDAFEQKVPAGRARKKRRSTNDLSPNPARFISLLDKQSFAAAAHSDVA